VPGCWREEDSGIASVSVELSWLRGDDRPGSGLKIPLRFHCERVAVRVRASKRSRYAGYRLRRCPGTGSNPGAPIASRGASTYEQSRMCPRIAGFFVPGSGVFVGVRRHDRRRTAAAAADSAAEPPQGIPWLERRGGWVLRHGGWAARWFSLRRVGAALLLAGVAGRRSSRFVRVRWRGVGRAWCRRLR
jgi:hypothetical protein